MKLVDGCKTTFGLFASFIALEAKDLTHHLAPIILPSHNNVRCVNETGRVCQRCNRWVSGYLSSGFLSYRNEGKRI